MKTQVLEVKLESLKQQTISKVNALLQENLGNEWMVENLGWQSIIFGVKNDDDSRALKFGQEIEMYFGKRHPKGAERFQMNFGSTGCFWLKEEEDHEGRMNFYIGVGRLLENKSLLNKLNSILVKFSNEWLSIIEQLKC